MTVKLRWLPALKNAAASARLIKTASHTAMIPDKATVWLKDTIPSPSNSKDFHSGIMTNCDSMREKIKIKNDGKLVDVLCRGNYGKDYDINGRVTLELHVSEASQTYKGFEAIYTLFHVSDNDGNCQNKDDFRCGNGRCIPGYLRDKQRDHCGNSSNVLTAWKGLTLTIVIPWLLSIVSAL
ncbi:uncharacterized protein [Ptychodera flava]|uniref:uncharacterized protein n=1 Tax=Ptychodera flava TaxID=63121 RepID=UPI00396A02C6